MHWILGAVIGRRHQGDSHPEPMGCHGWESREKSNSGGQSISCESIKKEKAGTWPWAGGSLRQAVTMQKQEAPWKEVLFEGLW